MAKLNWANIIHDTYVELYKNSTPQADFDQLVNEAKTNNKKDLQGRYVIDFMAYEIDKDKMEEIIQYFVKKYKMNKTNASQYSFTIYMGCSPKTKSNE